MKTWPAYVAIGLAVVGCSASTDPFGLDERVLDRVLVEGRLIARGEPVDRANIRIDVLPLGCEEDALARWLDIHPDSQGRFREEVGILDSPTPFRGCLEITVVPIGYPNLTTTTVILDEVQFVRYSDDPATVEIEIEILTG